MRALLIRSSPWLGGLERFLVMLAAGLRGRGMNVHIAALHRAGPHPLVAHAQRYDIPAYAVSDPSPLSITPLRSLWALSRTLHPHVIYGLDYKSNALAHVLARLLPHRPPVVTAVHGYANTSWRLRVYRWLDNWVSKQSSAVVVPSTLLQEALTRRGLPSGRVHVIPPAPDWHRVDWWAAQPLPLDDVRSLEEEPLLLFVGRLSPEKGPDRLVAALPYLQEQHPGLRLWFVGDGPLREELARRVARLGLERRVQFWRWQENPYPFMRAASWVMVPSRAEGFGLTALEALGLGVPLMATAVGHLRLLVRPPGILLSAKEEAALLGQSIAEQVKNIPPAEERERLRNWVRRTFSLGEALRRHLSLFTLLVEG